MMEIEQKTLIIGVICLFVIGTLLGVLAAFYIIQTPLNEHYQTELARVTNNGRLTCFDLSNMTIKGEPMVVDTFQINSCFNALEICERLNPLGKKTEMPNWTIVKPS